MSKGPGHIQRSFLDAFRAMPGSVMGGVQLVAIAFPGIEPGPNHYSAVSRAARRLAEERCEFESHPGRAGSGGRLLVDATVTHSLAVGRVFAYFNGTRTIVECENFLNAPKTEARREALPGGFFSLLAHRNRLWADGRDAEADLLTVQIRERVDQAGRMHSEPAQGTIT